MDAVSIANIQAVHDNQTLVSSTAINLTGRQLGRHVGLHKHDYRTRKLLTLYNCSEWAPPPPAGPAAAPAPDAPAQRHDNDNAHPLSLPLLNLLASLRARQDEENGENTVRPSLTPQRQVTKRIMQQWTLHKLMLRNPPTDRMRDVRLLHCAQSVPLLDEHSRY